MSDAPTSLTDFLDRAASSDSVQDRLRKLGELPGPGSEVIDGAQWNSFNSFEAFERWR